MFPRVGVFMGPEAYLGPIQFKKYWPETKPSMGHKRLAWTFRQLEWAGLNRAFYQLFGKYILNYKYSLGGSGTGLST